MTDNTDRNAVKVTINGQAMPLDEVRNAMDSGIRNELAAKHPNADKAEGAQAFVDAYAREHQQRLGKPFTGRKEA